MCSSSTGAGGSFERSAGELSFYALAWEIAMSTYVCPKCQAQELRGTKRIAEYECGNCGVVWLLLEVDRENLDYPDLLSALSEAAAPEVAIVSGEMVDQIDKGVSL